MQINNTTNSKKSNRTSKLPVYVFVWWAVSAPFGSVRTWSKPVLRVNKSNHSLLSKKTRDYGNGEGADKKGITKGMQLRLWKNKTNTIGQGDGERESVGTERHQRNERDRNGEYETRRRVSWEGHERAERVWRNERAERNESVTCGHVYMCVVVVVHCIRE